MLTPRVQGNVEYCSCTVALTSCADLRLLVHAIGSAAAPIVGANIDPSFPLNGFHSAACGPAIAKFAMLPEIWTQSVLFTVSNDGSAESGAACELSVLLCWDELICILNQWDNDGLNTPKLYVGLKMFRCPCDQLPFFLSYGLDILYKAPRVGEYETWKALVTTSVVVRIPPIFPAVLE